ncbi:HpcH/HpaI aldolase/citrate lyase family protein [Microvirga calopogonii]|uniref:HpcH/HpaI aldolase/citrate lyase family protein n=1 Tax=Microvirga calopogonii TaxID=2078013 RepID=UPI000E0D9F47|nr:CoA ester lyase [Microvirga calopogonii]
MLRLRSWMFVPGHSEKMVSKALALDLDAVMLDLEDGVVPSLKASARPIVAGALAGAGPSRPARYVRVNGIETQDLIPDLEAVVGPGLDGLVVPKIETVEQVEAIAGLLDRLEGGRRLPPGAVRLMLAIETAKAVLAAPALAAASSRVSGLMFGAEDFSRDLGLPTFRTGRARDFIYARSAIVTAAAAAKVTAIDGVWPDLTDEEGLEQDAVLARDLGFAGKSMIHPGQIAAVHRVFTPTAEEIAFAQHLISDFEKAVADGSGSISFGGQLVDRPIYERACAVVRQATATITMA